MPISARYFIKPYQPHNYRQLFPYVTSLVLISQCAIAVILNHDRGTDCSIGADL